jgi:hypothetical protein
MFGIIYNEDSLIQLIPAEESDMFQVYNYLQSSLPVKREVMYPAKNRGELKRVYDNIVSLSKRSPYYKINISKENQEYTFGIKDTALELKSKLYSMFDPEISNFNTKAISVSDESILTAKLLSEDTQQIPDDIKFKVNQLASVQVNKGKELRNDSRALPPGTYEFEVKVRNQSYPLAFVQPERTSNLNTMKNVVNYLNQAVPGLLFSVEEGEDKEYCYMRISGEMSGRYGENNFSFEDMDYYDVGIAEFFGMNRVEQEASCAQFELNDTMKQTATNTFTLENTLFVSLQNTKENPVTVKVTADSEKVLESVESVLSVYNRLIKIAKDRTVSSEDSYNASKLIGEMKSLESMYGEELTACGIESSEDGTLKITDSLAVQAAKDGGMEDLFTRKNGFITRLQEKAEAIAINPMEYLEKTVVLYPNTEKSSFANPYVTSMYSGLFFNSYC